MKARLISLLRWSERYTKTDMVYLATTGLWLNLNLVIVSIFSLLLSVVFANVLTPTAYGLYQYLITLSALVAAVCLSGMNTAVTQAVARGFEGVFKRAVRIQLWWALVPSSFALAVAIYYFLQGNASVGFGLVTIAVLAPIIQTFNTYSAFLEGRRAFRLNFFLGLGVNLTYYASMFIALLWVRDATLLVTLNLGINALTTFLAYRKVITHCRPNDRDDISAIPYGKHLSVLSAFGTIMNQLDSVLVFHFLGAANLAVYSLATMLPERAAGFFNFIGAASLPRFANQPLTFIRTHLPGKLARVALAGFGVAAVYVGAAPFLFAILFPRYLAAVPYTQLYAFIIVLMAVTTVSSTVLFAKRFTREIYVLGLIQPVLLVGLQIPLLLVYSIWGMILARIGADIVTILLSVWFTFHPLVPPREEPEVEAFV